MSALPSKLNRKRAKYSSILHNVYDMKPSSGTSRRLMVCNAGLSLGISKEDLFDAFHTFGKIQNIKMVPKESHAFVEFANISEAERCFELCNGQLCLPTLKGPLYLLFVDDLPDVPCVDMFKTPPGCMVFKEFISEEEEQLLLDNVKDKFNERGDLKQRKVAHFGYEFIYGQNNIDRDKPLKEKIPSACDFINSRFLEKGYALPWQADQLTVNHYLPGQGIPPHVDTHSAFEDPIMSLSLGADVVMEFRQGENHWSVVLPRRSMLVMSGESRYDWTHGITSRKSDIFLDETGGLQTKERGTRTSFTFRAIRFTPCDCKFERLCDSRHETQTEEPLSPFVESEYVHKVYENISNHFSQTRHKPWPAVLDLVKSLEPGSVLLDVGCGNCKYFGFAFSLCEIGSDHSLGLLTISKDRGFQTVRNNCLSLPLREESVDCVICIAVIHHLSSRERRVHSIKEILRVLAPKGQALIYVWAKDQMYKGKSSHYLKHPSQVDQKSLENLKTSAANLPVHVNRTNFSQNQNDVFVPWKLKTNSSPKPESTFLRFYHVFDENELDDLCVEAGARIIRSYHDNGNWCCLIGRSTSVS